MKKIFCLLTSVMMLSSCFNLFSIKVSANADHLYNAPNGNTSIIKIVNDKMTEMYFDPNNEIVFMYDEYGNKILLSYAIDEFNNTNDTLYTESGNLAQVIKFIDSLKTKSSGPDESDFKSHFTKKNVKARKKIVVTETLIDLGIDEIASSISQFAWHTVSDAPGIYVFGVGFIIHEVANAIFDLHKEDYYYVEEIVFKNNTCPSYLLGDAKYIDYGSYYDISSFKTTWTDNPSLGVMTTACKAEANVFPYQNY